MDIVQLSMFDGKVCAKCGEWKDHESGFAKDKTKKNGYSSHCRTCRGSYGRKYWANNVDRLHVYRAHYIAENRETLNQKKKDHLQAYRDTNPEEHRRRSRAWSRNNPERVRVIRQKRRARERNSATSYTVRQWSVLCYWFGNVCLACAASEKLTPDHVVPLARGGSNDISNIQPLCLSCNMRKHTKTIDYRNPDRLRAFLEHIQCSLPETILHSRQ